MKIDKMGKWREKLVGIYVYLGWDGFMLELSYDIYDFCFHILLFKFRRGGY